MRVVVGFGLFAGCLLQACSSGISDSQEQARAIAKKEVSQTNAECKNAKENFAALDRRFQELKKAGPSSPSVSCPPPTEPAFDACIISNDLAAKKRSELQTLKIQHEKSARQVETACRAGQ
jgi:hypothetical protein